MARLSIPRHLASKPRTDATFWRYSVGPLSLLRLRAPSLEGVGTRGTQAVRGYAQRCARIAQGLPLILAPVVAFIASTQVRHWLGELMATVCVVGGFIAAPLLTVTAWVGLALPARVPLHQASTTLFLVAVIWLALALICAHCYQQIQRQPDED
jgi:hypothetical protein